MFATWGDRDVEELVRLIRTFTDAMSLKIAQNDRRNPAPRLACRAHHPLGPRRPRYNRDGVHLLTHMCGSLEPSLPSREHAPGHQGIAYVGYRQDRKPPHQTKGNFLMVCLGMSMANDANTQAMVIVVKLHPYQSMFGPLAVFGGPKPQAKQ